MPNPKSEIAIVLLDLMRPEIDGLMTLRAPKMLNPQVRAIALSGSAARPWMEDAMNQGFGRF